MIVTFNTFTHKHLPGDRWRVFNLTKRQILPFFAKLLLDGHWNVQWDMSLPLSPSLLHSLFNVQGPASDNHTAINGELWVIHLDDQINRQQRRQQQFEDEVSSGTSHLNTKDLNTSTCDIWTRVKGKRGGKRSKGQWRVWPEAHLHQWPLRSWPPRWVLPLVRAQVNMIQLIRSAFSFEGNNWSFGVRRVSNSSRGSIATQLTVWRERWVFCPTDITRSPDELFEMDNTKSHFGPFWTRVQFGVE